MLAVKRHIYYFLPRYGRRSSTYTSDYCAPSARFSSALAAVNKCSPFGRSHGVLNSNSRPFLRSVSVSPNRHGLRARDTLAPVVPARTYLMRNRVDDALDINSNSRSVSRMRYEVYNFCK